MTAKRTPKPLPNGATSFLLEKMMPFLTLDPYQMGAGLARADNSEVDRLANILFPAVAMPLSDMLKQDQQTVSRLMGELWREKKAVGHLLTTLTGYQVMIRVATIPGANGLIQFPSGFPEKIDGQDRPSENATLVAWMKTALAKMEMVPLWAGKGHSRVDYRPVGLGKGSLADDFLLWLHGFRGSLILTASEAFSAWVGEQSNGEFYVGACPRCRKIFEKKRGDQEYCSGACRDAARMARLREK